MTTEITGERFVPEAMGGQLIEAEHVARYALASRLAPGARVLDAGCGVGWGTGMLLTAGAASAVGLDLDADAVADARRRVPDADFVRGDLAELPWPDGSFDLVVCFEALEHVTAQDQALDELVRVLDTDGVLLVSSPNPEVYPAGNPFHEHEFTPDELAEAVGTRLPHVTVWHQHTQIASVLATGEDLVPGSTTEVLARVVAPLGPGRDPYSLVCAGRALPPRLPPLVSCAPEDQLLHLEALVTAVGDERERVAQDRSRVEADRAAVALERQQLLDAVDVARRDREHTALLLLESEQELARSLAAPAPCQEPPTADRDVAAVVDALVAQVAELRGELEALRSSTSWQATRPLRAVSRHLGRRR